MCLPDVYIFIFTIGKQAWCVGVWVVLPKKTPVREEYYEETTFWSRDSWERGDVHLGTMWGKQFEEGKRMKSRLRLSMIG